MIFTNSEHSHHTRKHNKFNAQIVVHSLFGNTLIAIQIRFEHV